MKPRLTHSMRRLYCKDLNTTLLPPSTTLCDSSTTLLDPSIPPFSIPVPPFSIPVPPLCLLQHNIPSHKTSSSSCRTILSDPTLVEYVNTSMVFWGCSVTSAEGYRVSQALRENSYPFLALVVLRDGRMTVVGRLEELIPAPQLTTRLQGLVRENEAHLVVARAER